MAWSLNISVGMCQHVRLATTCGSSIHCVTCIKGAVHSSQPCCITATNSTKDSEGKQQI